MELIYDSQQSSRAVKNRRDDIGLCLGWWLFVGEKVKKIYCVFIAVRLILEILIALYPQYMQMSKGLKAVK